MALGLLVLQHFDVPYECIDLGAHTAIGIMWRFIRQTNAAITIAPNGHFSCAVRSNGCPSVDELGYSQFRKPTTVGLGNLRQIRRWYCLPLCKRPVAVSINAVTRHAGKFVLRQAEMFIINLRQAIACHNHRYTEKKSCNPHNKLTFYQRYVCFSQVSKGGALGGIIQGRALYA